MKWGIRFREFGTGFFYFMHIKQTKDEKTFTVGLCAFAFVACSDDEYNYFELPASYTVDFEDARLGDDGYIWGKSQAVTLDEDLRKPSFSVPVRNISLRRFIPRVLLRSGRFIPIIWGFTGRLTIRGTAS